MKNIVIAHPISDAIALRVRHMLGGAVATICAGSFAQTALAQNECGGLVNGSVTCTASATRYASGIHYNATSGIDVIAPAGVMVTTTAPAINGITIIGTGTSKLSGGALVTTMGDGSDGVLLTSGSGPASITVGNITTSGALSAGIVATAGLNQSVSITAGDVTTTGTTANTLSVLPGSTAIKAAAMGNGDLAIAAGAISTTAGGAPGINASAAIGNIGMAIGAVTTSGDASDGVLAQSNSGSIGVVLYGDINAAGQQSTGVSATALNGAAYVLVQNVNMTGTSNSNGVIARAGAGGATISAGNVSVAGAFGTGLEAISAGGSASITANTITATGTAGTAAYAMSDVGVASITSTGNVVVTGRGAMGLIAQSGTGSAAVTANNVSVIAANAADTLTTGNAILAQGANAMVVVTGTAATAGIAQYAAPVFSGDAVRAMANNGAANVTVQNVSATGTNSRAIAATASGQANVTVSGSVISTNGDAIDIIGGTTATLITATGSSVFGGLDGASIASLAGTTVDNAGTLGGAVYALSTTGGSAQVNNSGTINGAIALAGGRDVVNNSGTFNAAGTSSFGIGDVFNNTGIVAVASSGSIASAVTLAGLATFNNTGVIELRNGVVGDTLTIGGNYVGSGKAVLGVDVLPGATTVADQLIINGAASGSTQVLVALAPGARPAFSNATTIVQAGAVSSATAFAVAPSTQNFGLVRYDVVYNPANLSYSLVGAPGDSAYNMLTLETAERNLWYRSADAVTTELRSKRDQLWSMGGTSPLGRFWVTMAASYDNARGYRDFGAMGQGHLTDTRYRQNYFGGQLGFDLSGGLFNRGGFAVGVTSGYINSKVKLGSGLDKADFDAVNGGAYISFTSGKIFATALGKYDYYWARPDSVSAGFNQHLHGHSYGGRGEIGARFGGESLFVEPLVQISYVRTALDPFDVQGTSIDFVNRNGLRGKVGGRIGGNTGINSDIKLAFYAGASYVHDFHSRSEVTFANLGGAYTVYGQKTRDAAEGLVGLNLASVHRITGFMEATYKRSFGNGENGQLTEEGAGGRVGIRVQF